MPWGISFHREKKPVVSTPVEIKKGLHLCDSCDAFPEGTKIVYNKENCSRGYVLLEDKSDCKGYILRSK